MIYILLSVFFLTFIASLFEERTKRYNKAIYISIGVILFLCAGFKEIGFDNDSENYEFFYNHYDDPYVQMAVEYSYLFLSQLFNSLTDDAHIMFILYSGAGILLKMTAMKRLSELWFLPLLVYMGNYYILHDMTQIRACVVSGIFMMAIIPLAENRKGLTALLLLLGCVFHYSTLALFPVLFLSNKDMSKRTRLMWSLLVPLGYLLCFANINLLTEIPIPYIGDKLAAYQELSERGIKGSDINIFNAVFVVTWFTYIYILYFYDTVIKHNKYLPLMLRLTGLSVFSFLALSFLPVLSFRISELYGIAEIFIFANIYYTIKPGWLAKSVVAIVGIALFCINAFYAEFLHP